MKFLLPYLSLLAVGAAAFSPALAQTGGSGESSIAPDTNGRPYAPTMSCAALVSLVGQRGSVVISTGPYTYDRVVRDRSFCPFEQTSAPEFAPTSDNRQCFAGLRCVDRTSEGSSRE